MYISPNINPHPISWLLRLRFKNNSFDYTFIEYIITLTQMYFAILENDKINLDFQDNINSICIFKIILIVFYVS